MPSLIPSSSRPQESRQGVELMRMWAPVDAADALELLSPAFVSEEVGGARAG